MESALVDQTVDPMIRCNPGTDVANILRTESLLETTKRMLTSKNAKIATNANFYPIGKKLTQF